MDCSTLNQSSGGTVGVRAKQRRPQPPDDPNPDPDRQVGHGDTAAGLLARVDDKALARALLAHNGHELGFFDIPQLAYLHPNEIDTELKRRDKLSAPEVNDLVAQGIQGWVR